MDKHYADDDFFSSLNDPNRDKNFVDITNFDLEIIDPSMNLLEATLHYPKNIEGFLASIIAINIPIDLSEIRLYFYAEEESLIFNALLEWMINRKNEITESLDIAGTLGGSEEEDGDLFAKEFIIKLKSKDVDLKYHTTWTVKNPVLGMAWQQTKSGQHVLFIDRRAGEEERGDKNDRKMLITLSLGHQNIRVTDHLREKFAKKEEDKELIFAAAPPRKK